MSLESMLASLTPEEKLNAMDILWRDLSANPARLSSPDWHGDVLAHRIANPSSVPIVLMFSPFLVLQHYVRCTIQFKYLPTIM